MKISLTRKQLTRLCADHPEYREWRAVEAASRHETNDLRRAGFDHVFTDDGIDYWGKR